MNRMTDNDLTVNTKNGKIRGYLTHNKVLSFKGIPFAESPIGKLRFETPKPKNSWSGVLDAHKFGPIAPQPVLGLGASSQESIEQS